MSKSNTFETGILNLIFTNTNLANIGDTAGLRGASAAGSFYISLHSADPGEAGDQTTSEMSWTGYNRIAIVRTSGAWSVSTNIAANNTIMSFATCTAGSGTALFFGIGTTITGAGTLLYSGSLTSSGLAISPGITPSFAVGKLTVTED